MTPKRPEVNIVKKEHKNEEKEDRKIAKNMTKAQQAE